MGGDGVVVIAYGGRARRLAEECIASLHRFHPWPVAVIGDGKVTGAAYHVLDWPNEGRAGRWAKVNLDVLSPFDRTLLLDADTVVMRGGLDVGFRLLDDGADVVMVASEGQGPRWLAHVSDEERAMTARMCGGIIQLNTGVVWFGRGAGPLFEAWRAEWRRFRDRDQAALLRALKHCPVSVRLLGWRYNTRHRSAAIVWHRFGMCGG